MAKEQCDDGNEEDGDGCSNKCTIENSYECQWGNAMGSDLCDLGTPTLDCGSMSLIKTFQSNDPSFGIKTRFQASETSKHIEKFTIQYMRKRDVGWSNACACIASPLASCSPAPAAGQSGGNCSITMQGSDIIISTWGFKLGSQYHVRVEGENKLGRSGWCESSETILMMGLPAPIDSLNLVALPDGSICASWAVPADIGLGSGITTIDVSLSWTLEKSKGKIAGVNAILYKLPGEQTEMCFSDLILGSEWTFRLVMCNEVGCSSFDQSPVRDPITVPAKATLDYVSAKQGDMRTSTSITVVLLGLPVVFEGLEMQVSTSSGAIIGKVTSPPQAVQSLASPGVQFTISLGPVQRAAELEIAIQCTASSAIQFAQVSFGFEFYDSGVARILSMTPSVGSNSGHSMVKLVLSGFQADSVDDVLVLFDGAESDLSMSKGVSNGLSTLYATVPQASYEGLVDVELISRGGAHIKAQFLYADKCDTGLFCSGLGAAHVPLASDANIGETCKLHNCINMNDDPRATAHVVSATPCSADLAGGAEVELALAHFPLFDALSQVSVKFGADETSAVVSDMLYSDRIGAGVRIVLPPVAQAGTSFGIVRAGSIHAIFNFVFHDSRAEVTCANVALADEEWCMGSFMGGDVIIVSVTNFGRIERKEDISVRFASVFGLVQEIEESRLQLLTIKILVPPMLPKNSDCDVDLTISNLVSDSAILVRSATTSFRYIASPFLTSAVLEPHGGGFILSFSVKTKNGESMLQTNCSNFLSDDCVSKLGHEAECFWKSASELQVSFGPSATININDVVTVRRNVVVHFSSLDLGLDRESVARLRPPAAAFIPSFSIFGPDQLGPCDTIELNAGAIGLWQPRRLTFHWQCASCDCNTDEASLCAKLLATTGDRLRLASGDMRASNTYYTIAVTATNFFGMSSEQHTKRVWRAKDSIPLLSLSARQAYTEGENLLVKVSHVAFSRCTGNQAGQVDLMWSQLALGGKTDGKVPAKYLSEAKNSPSLSIPGSTLPIGRYVFVVQAKIASAPPQFSEAQVSVSILPSVWDAVIQGGNSKISTKTQVFKLSASLSYGAPSWDQEADSLASIRSMSFAWKCTMYGYAPCRDANDFSVLAFDNTATIQVYTNLLHPGRYQFEVSIELGDMTIVRKTSVTLVTEYVPSMAISSSGTVLKDGITWMNPQQRLILRETECTTCSNFAWAVKDGRIFAPLKTSEKSLVINAGLLQPGRRYEFTVSAIADNGATGRASLNVTVLTGASGGSCSLRLADSPTLAFLSVDMVSGKTISDVTHEIYSAYPDAFAGCKQTRSCGSLVVSVSDAKAILTAGKSYLIVASKSGYYNGYFTIDLGADDDELEVRLVKELSADQDRVVLRWGHTQDLDIWVYDKSDMKKSVGWDTSGEPPSASFAGGTITLDVDVQEGPGVETTQFMSVDSGTIEVWVNHYDEVFTSKQVLEHPATVDVYCYQCLDDSKQQKAGYVKSVTQNTADVPGDGRNWWNVGAFTWPSGPARAKWTTCVTDCYRNAEAADLTSTRALWSSAPKLGKEHASAALLRHMRRQPSSSAQFARHENFRVDCWGFVALAEPLSFQFGYTSDSGSFFFVPGVLAVKNLYLPSGNVQPVVKIQVGVFCFALVPR